MLCKHFGMAHIAIAEDIASETFVSALEIWPRQGIPDNPTAWLYTVAKNKAKNHINRRVTFTQKIAQNLSNIPLESQEIDIDLSEQNVTDSQLQMLFAICHPVISKEAQIGLALRILGGFGIDEIADAFLTSKETINKRLYRGREKLRSEQVAIVMPDESEIHERLDTVLTTLYLLFSEGYYSESQNTVIRKDLCLEAMRLTYLLIENQSTNCPSVNALLALMCFHTSRFDARKNERGELILYRDQDESLWNKDLMAKGAYFLHQASHGAEVTRYHLEASIAYWHTVKSDTPEKWKTILRLYDQLLEKNSSPIAALNRVFAFSKVHGKSEAIAEAEKLKLTNNHFYFTLLGALYTGVDNQKAKTSFQEALSLAKTNTDRQVIQTNVDKL